MFKKKFLNLRTKAILRKNDALRESTAFQKAKFVGIIFAIEGMEKHKAVKRFIKDLEDEGKEVEVLTYLGKGRDNHEFLFDFIAPGDISFWGNITNQRALTFAEKEFDYLFNFDNSRNHVIENILARSKAKCRVGCYSKENLDFFEFMVQPQSVGTEGSIVGDLSHYVRKITVNGNG